MTNMVIRQQLHQYIAITDDEKVEALYTLLQNDLEPTYAYTDQEIGMLHEHAENYLSGGVKTYTVEESHDKIRAQSI